MTKTTITAADIQRLLAARHASDVWVAQCKNGPTWTAHQVRILDGWALRKSWSPWTAVGYEIKVARSDFEQDQKWGEYLPVCHEFYFVCPGGLIKTNDLPEGVGLIWVGANGQKLHTKIKARRREPDPQALARLMSYVLMSRARVVADMDEANRPAAEEPERDRRLRLHREAVEWTEKRRELAQFVNKHVRERFNEQERRLREMEAKAADADRLREHLAGLGIDWRPSTRGEYGNTWEVRRQIDKLAGRIPDDLERDLDHAARHLTSMAETVRQLRVGKAEAA